MAIRYTIGKKGFMFTLVTIFLISIFVFILYSRSSNVMIDQQYASAERTEAVVVNLFTQLLTQEYINSIVKVSSANALHAMIVYVNDTRTAIEEPEEFFKQILVDGTIDGTYSSSAMSNDFAMRLTAVNNSQEIILASTPKYTTLSFGDTIALVEVISTEDDLQSLHRLTLNITNNTAETGDIYLLVYNATTSDKGGLVALDYQKFTWTDFNTHEMTFSFPYNLPLGPDKEYYLVLAAPFAGVDGFSADMATTSCSLCSAETWIIGDTGETLGFPFDFSLPYAVIGKGFLRSLMNSFETLGKEKLNIDTTINFINIEVSGDPWNVDVNATFLVNTEKTTVSFSDIYSEGIGEVSIIGMYDPYSILRTDLLTNQYFQIIPQNVSDEFDEEDFYTHLSQHTFVFNENAPSYLQRFAGEDAAGVSSSCCGIQAVYLDSDILIDSDQRGYSYVDHMFHESTQCNADGITDPLYAISVSSLDSEYQTLFNDLGISSHAPLFDYASIEFYNMADHYSSGYCPTSSSTT